MEDTPPNRAVQAACLEASIRKALADAWAVGATGSEAQRIAVGKLHKKFPELPSREILKLVRNLRPESG